MIKIDELLQKAHGFFVAQEYDKALFLYSQISYTQPTNLEYQLYALFCDIASEDSNKAQELFDYFIIKKEEDFSNAIEFIKNSIDAYDGDQELILRMIQDVTKQSVESLDAIEYEDFLQLEKARGSFRVAYEDIMFSTKVAIQSKDDLVDFINKLIENGFDTTAYSYLDGFNEVFSYDKDLTTLYEKLESKNIDNKQ